MLAKNWAGVRKLLKNFQKRAGDIRKAHRQPTPEEKSDLDGNDFMMKPLLYTRYSQDSRHRYEIYL